MNLKKHNIFSKENLNRLFILLFFYIFASISHNISQNYNQEIISAFIILIIFSTILIEEYKSLFKKNLPKKEYFLNMFFIIFFTIMMYSTIYAWEIHWWGSYFIENWKKILDLPYFDAMYFSISTLTTVWYWDIAPVWIFRLFASIEIFTWLIYTGTMVYIFTNHLDKNE